MTKRPAKREPKRRNDAFRPHRPPVWTASEADWLKIAAAYDPQLHACFLALAAVAAEEAAKVAEEAATKAKSGDALEKRTRARQDAKRAALKFSDAAKSSPKKHLVDGGLKRAAETATKFREKVSLAVNAYLAQAQREREASHASAARDWLMELSDAARSVVAAYAPEAAIARLPHDAKLELRLEVESRMRSLVQDGAQFRLVEFVETTRRLAWAASATAREVAGDGMLDPKTGWEALIRRLADVARAYRLPDGISSELSADGSEPPFVRFFRAIQETLPAEERHSLGGDGGALAKAAQRAKAARRSVKKNK
jgi:hypothetical protein